MGVGLSVILNRGGSLQCADGLLESSVLCALGASHAQNPPLEAHDSRTIIHANPAPASLRTSFFSASSLHLRSEMDVIPMCSIFQELQIVHDTGYFSALPSLEEYWQQVNDSFCSLHLHLHLNTRSVTDGVSL